MGVPPPPPGSDWYNVYEVTRPAGGTKKAKQDFEQAWKAYVTAVRGLRTAMAGLGVDLKFRDNFLKHKVEFGGKRSRPAPRSRKRSR